LFLEPLLEVSRIFPLILSTSLRCLFRREETKLMPLAKRSSLSIQIFLRFAQFLTKCVLVIIQWRNPGNELSVFLRVKANTQDYRIVRVKPRKLSFR
jgi:hypothetical protein